MLTGLYSAASALESSGRQHEVIAQNLAHAQMPGYRRAILRNTTLETSFDGELQQALQSQRLGTSNSELTSDFSTGSLEQTGSPLDFALQGKGFFVVQGPSGPLYTRNGTFRLDDTGRLVTGDGLTVEGDGGEITLDPGSSTTHLSVQRDGTLMSGGNVQVGKLKIVEFEDPHLLQRAGITLFSSPNGLEPQDSATTVIQGWRERSNVSPVQELVNLIATQRHYEAAERSMKSISDAVESHIDLRG